MLTAGSGVTTEDGTRLHRLKYVERNQNASVQAGATATFSYIRGGGRFTITGPCQVTFLESGPQKTGGKGSIERYLPSKRVGKELPPELNLKFGLHVRRGELHLHLPRCTLPEKQSVSFSATPAFTRFYLTVFDSQGRKFESEELKDKSWQIPEDLLKPGETYEFILEGFTDSGRREELEPKKVIVLDAAAAALVLQATRSRQDGSDPVGQMELLAFYLRYRLDAHALRTLRRIPSLVKSDRFLRETEKALETQMEYVTRE